MKTPGVGVEWRAVKEQIYNKDTGSAGGMEDGERADQPQGRKEWGSNGGQGKSRSAIRIPGVRVEWRAGKEQIYNKDTGSAGGMENGERADQPRGRQEWGSNGGWEKSRSVIRMPGVRVEWRAGK